ncbi:MAG TPA: hypothetical protein VF267_06745 [Gammaproteobacteria bacterium]
MNESPGRQDALIDATYRQALATFEKEIENGERDPAAELATYRRRRRDYASLLRLGQVPDEARELAGRLVETHDLDNAGQPFEEAVTRLLIRLYDAFIARAEQE